MSVSQAFPPSYLHGLFFETLKPPKTAYISHHLYSLLVFDKRNFYYRVNLFNHLLFDLISAPYSPPAFYVLLK